MSKMIFGANSVWCQQRLVAELTALLDFGQQL